MTDQCANIRECLSAYMDNELPADRQVAVANHLAACAGCREEMATLRQMETLLTAWEVAPLPARTVAHFADALAARRKTRRLVAPLAWSTAAAGLTLVVLLAVYRPQDPPRQFALLPVPSMQVNQHVDNLANPPSVEYRRPNLPFSLAKSNQPSDSAAKANSLKVRGLPIWDTADTTLISIYPEETINIRLQETDIKSQIKTMVFSGSEETMIDRLAETIE